MASKNRSSNPENAEVIVLYPRQQTEGYPAMVGAILHPSAFGKIPAESFFEELRELSTDPTIPTNTRGAKIRLPRPTILGSHNAAKSLRTKLGRLGIKAITQEMPGTKEVAEALKVD